MIESLCINLHCLSAALLCYTGFQNQSLIRSTSCSCSTCCFGLGFQHQNLQDFIKIPRALIKNISLLLYAYQGLNVTTKDAEPVDDHVPASIPQRGSSLHSDEDLEDKSKILDPRVQKLMMTYLEVFAELPPPASCDKVVQMDLNLSSWVTRYVGGPTRLLKILKSRSIKLTDRYKSASTLAFFWSTKIKNNPEHCSPCFLLAEPGSTAKRLVVDYNKHTHTPTPQPGVAGRSPNLAPSTHTHTARPGQEWRGTNGERTQTKTHPNTPGSSGGAQPQPEPKHSHPHRTPQPRVAGYKRSAYTDTDTCQHPSQEWRGAAET